MKKLFLVSAFAFASFTLSAQWDTLQTGTTAGFYSVSFTSADSGVVAGYDAVNDAGIILRTTDGGMTWSQPSMPAGIPALHAIKFFSATNGWAAGSNGIVLMTTDGGASWDSLPQRFTNENLLCMASPSITNIYIAGSNGSLFESMDAGSTWNTISSGTTLAINDTYYAYPGTGWLAGNGGYLAATADDGATWTQFTQPYYGFFQVNGFAYAGTTNNAFAVGASGLGVFSTDAGLTWDTLSLAGNADLNKVRFVNDLGGVICGDSGTIFRTTDGGMSWMRESANGVTENLTDISFAGDTTAYICGMNGRVLKSHNDISSVHTVFPAALSINAFPNPFENNLSVMIHVTEAAPFTISICDISGRIVSTQQTGMLFPGMQLVQPEGISDLAPGMYLVKVSGGNSTGTLPVIKR